MKKITMITSILLIVVISMLAIAAPALAAPRCSYNKNHGWHIVGGSETNHWYETEEQCLIDLRVTEILETLTITPDPTETVTETPEPTEEVTETPDPTETVVVTETPDPTEEVTETPEPTEIVVTETPQPEIERQPKTKSCEWVWKNLIVSTMHKEVGYRFFDKREQCPAWLWNTYQIDYDLYKVMNPVY